MRSPAIHPDDPDLARLGAEGRVVAYFGYGSLVNRDTLRTKFLGIRAAQVRGWRRFWLYRGEGTLALLSVRRDSEAAIDGVVVYDRADQLAAVDARECDYDRRLVQPPDLVIRPDAPVRTPVYLYEGRRDREITEARRAPILQSYLDAVMQGFLAVHGESGLERFVAETEGFETTILRDRDAPRYPRSVALRPGEVERFDALLAARGAIFDDASR